MLRLRRRQIDPAGAPTDYPGAAAPHAEQALRISRMQRDYRLELAVSLTLRSGGAVRESRIALRAGSERPTFLGLPT
jgi:hypothetical protein